MWPVIYAFGTRFSTYLVLPFAAVIGTIGYYAEKKLMSRPKPIEYLEKSIQEQREARLQLPSAEDRPQGLPDTLGLLKPRPSD